MEHTLNVYTQIIVAASFERAHCLALVQYQGVLRAAVTELCNVIGPFEEELASTCEDEWMSASG
jgi:hypothetical protein